MVAFANAVSSLAAGTVNDPLQNLALNRAAYQSDSIDDDHTAHLATDGSTETFWESKPGGNSWVAVDLGEPCSFSRLVLRWGKSYATGFRLQSSNDGLHPKSWQDVLVSTNTTGGTQEISVPTTTARQVRLLVTGCSERNRGCVLSEIEIYGERKRRPAPAPQPAPRADNSVVLTGGNWKLQNAMFVQDTPEQIAGAGFDDRRWIPAVVPGTVLGSYLVSGAIPDPWYGDQMSQVSEDFFSRHDFWYRDSFVVPTNYAERRIWLDFDGINWKADVFLNGAKVGRIDGAFIRGRFEVTQMARPGETNYLAVLIHRVAHPGPGAKKVTHKRLGSPTTNGDELGADSPTFLASAGWNWLPIVRGRNLGIWNEVRLETSADVTIVDPWVTTELPLADHSRADLTVKTELRNHSSSPQSGTVIGSIGRLTFKQSVTLAPGESRALTFDKTTCPRLSLAHPSLWWPNGYGAQPLYQLRLRFEEAAKVSDEKMVNFGIRKIEYRLLDNVLTIFVNGCRILCRGGNWGMAEGMLNCDAAGLDLRVRLHRDANLNMIRNWVGMEGHEAFYDACDRYGILIWDDFWLANPLDGPDPVDHVMFMANVRDKILCVRSHPSEALYCGRNEGNPPADLDTGMRAAVDSLDGTRHYIPDSANNDHDSANNTVTGHGPYEIKDVDWYFANRGKTFHSEQGIVAVPPMESMRAMMPAENLWPINDMWAVHDYQTGRCQLYTKRLTARYGKPSGIEDYCRKAQLVNLESAKAIYECLQAKQGGGMLLWMTQSAWPSLICQLYDHYFEMTGAYFGAKQGCEPLHILWDANADLIKAANNTPTGRHGLTADARIYDLGGKEVWREARELDLPPTSVKDCFPITHPTNSPVFFVKLTLRQGEKILSDNFYWSSSRGGSCEALNELPPVKVAVEASQWHSNEVHQLAVRIKNPTANVALAIRLKLQRANSGGRILPVFYSDNYFSLLPGESRTIAVEFADVNLAGEAPKLMAEGWNLPAQEIAIDERGQNTVRAPHATSRF